MLIQNNQATKRKKERKKEKIYMNIPNVSLWGEDGHSSLVTQSSCVKK